MGKIRVAKGNGNVFEDLGLRDAAEHQLKARLVSKMIAMTKEQGMTQSEVAEKLEIGQPEVLFMINGHFRGFSVYQLMQFVSRLGAEVRINIVTRNTARRAEVEEIPILAH